MLKPVYLYVLYYIIYIHTTYIYVCVCNPSWWSSRIIDLGWRSPWTHDQHWSNVTTLGWMLKGTVIFFIHMFCTLDVQPGFWSPIVYIKYFFWCVGLRMGRLVFPSIFSTGICRSHGRDILVGLSSQFCNGEVGMISVGNEYSNAPMIVMIHFLATSSLRAHINT